VEKVCVILTGKALNYANIQIYYLSLITNFDTKIIETGQIYPHYLGPQCGLYSLEVPSCTFSTFIHCYCSFTDIIRASVDF